MTTMTPVATGVSLEALLAAKERRAQRQTDWLTHYQHPLISLTLVTPGAIKDSIHYRHVMALAIQACDQVLYRHRWQLLKHQVFWLPTGAEAFWSVKHSAPEIKAILVGLEQSHPLGRLWDFDVICPDNGLIGRRSLDKAVRRCLVCDGPAHACARSRRHPVEEVVEKVETMIHDWLARD